MSVLASWWLRGRGWLLAGLGFVLAVLAAVAGVRRWGAKREASGAVAGAVRARELGLEAARVDDAARATAELELDAQADAAELVVHQVAAERQHGPHTRKDLEALHARVESRRKK